MLVNALDTGEPLGDILRKQVIIPHYTTLTRAAKRLGMTRSGLSNVVNGNAILSFELAMRIEKNLGISAESLLVIQVKKQVSEARTKNAH